MYQLIRAHIAVQRFRFVGGYGYVLSLPMPKYISVTFDKNVTSGTR